MGGGAANSQHLLSSLIKENPADLWRKLCPERRIRHSSSSSGIISRRCYCTSSLVMKRRARLDRCSIRPRAGVEVQRKVRILKKLVPNSDSMGMERVLRETADYILGLQMRVEVMKIMVDVLSSSASHHHDYIQH
ncbi:Transcription factor UPBEAT1 [Sesamum angolense]|uniref:Transcription factor UPBEAT1 n=1 Tax=Sesamum angolense TaxID=2727404 RepID=A0AAE1X7V9_9LAMI|nr:Transcription factor UPBEAT1 [Sesamum angolense]